MELYPCYLLIALKRLGAKLCGIDKSDIDYQQVITALDTTMNTDDLRDYMTYMYEWPHADATGTEEFVAAQMNKLSGFRVEASFARLAQAAGFSLRSATRREDHKGLDFIVEGVPFDLKSSEQIAHYHTVKHKMATNRFHAVKFVPPITADNFGDRWLVVPDDQVERILATTDFRSMVEGAIARYREVNHLQSR